MKSTIKVQSITLMKQSDSSVREATDLLPVCQLKEEHECLNIYLNIKPQVFKTYTHNSTDVFSEF